MRTEHLPLVPRCARPSHALQVGPHLHDRRRAMVGREYPVSVQTSIAEKGPSNLFSVRELGEKAATGHRVVAGKRGKGSWFCVLESSQALPKRQFGSY